MVPKPQPHKHASSTLTHALTHKHALFAEPSPYFAAAAAPARLGPGSQVRRGPKAGAPYAGLDQKAHRKRLQSQDDAGLPNVA